MFFLQLALKYKHDKLLDPVLDVGTETAEKMHRN